MTAAELARKRAEEKYPMPDDDFDPGQCVRQIAHAETEEPLLELLKEVERSAWHKYECDANERHYEKPGSRALPLRKPCTCGFERVITKINTILQP